jgi:heme-degrading monooxygenase HmoA
MVARVTLAEIDTVRLPLRKAIELFEESILPALRELDGYEGAYVLATPEGKAQAVTFWTDEAAAEAGVESGVYDEQVQHYVAVFRSPPGRELYEVVVADVPAAASH